VVAAKPRGQVYDTRKRCVCRKDDFATNDGEQPFSGVPRIKLDISIFKRWLVYKGVHHSRGVLRSSTSPPSS